MNTKKKLVRSTAAQIKFLVEYMSTNPNFATGEGEYRINSGPLGARNLEVEWQNLKRNLDKFGPNKSVNQWKQTWKDLKKKARHERASERAEIKVVSQISEVSKQILDIIEYESSTGIGSEESPILTPQTFMHVEEDVWATHEVPDQPTDPPVHRPHDHQYTRTTRRLRNPRLRQINFHNQTNELASLLKKNNTLLKNLSEHLSERNCLIREQNSILREKNRILKRKKP